RGSRRVVVVAAPSSLHRHGDRRALHSFPTRRSSDLSPFKALPLEFFRRHEPKLAIDGMIAEIGKEGDADERKNETTEFSFFMVLDRKSTRLNSSHVKISYAVFCLKKKRIAIPSKTAP